MQNYLKSASQACRLIPGLALPMLIAACMGPKAVAPTGDTATRPGTVTVDGNCAIDRQSRGNGGVTFNGWAVGNPRIAPETITVTIGDGQPITATLYDRPDIAKAYRNQALTKTGFLVKVDDSNAPASAQIKIFANQSDKVHECAKTFTLK